MFYGSFFKPDVDVVQIEVSSRCDASCIYCPLTIYKGNIDKGFLPFKAIEILLPQLKKRTYIHLQGWGEPFLNPELPDMIEYIKSEGFRVGTTTNGNFIKESHLKRLVDIKLDYLAFSTAGFTEFENDCIRRGTSLKRIFRNIEILREIKKSENCFYPAVHIANILLRSEVENFFASEEIMRKLNPDQIVVSGLSLVSSLSFVKECFIADVENQWESLTKSLRALRERVDTDLHYNIVSPLILRDGCCENISGSIFVGVRGDVYPCVMKGVPLKKSDTFFLRGKETELEKKSFGNIFKTPLKEIWKNKEYRDFRKNKISKNDYCRICLKKSIDFLEPELAGYPDSFSCKWDIIREANREKEDRERLKKEVF